MSYPTVNPSDSVYKAVVLWQENRDLESVGFCVACHVFKADYLTRVRLPSETQDGYAMTSPVGLCWRCMSDIAKAGALIEARLIDPFPPQSGIPVKEYDNVES